MFKVVGENACEEGRCFRHLGSRTREGGADLKRAKQLEPSMAYEIRTDERVSGRLRSGLCGYSIRLNEGEGVTWSEQTN